MADPVALAASAANKVIQVKSYTTRAGRRVKAYVRGQTRKIARTIAPVAKQVAPLASQVAPAVTAGAKSFVQQTAADLQNPVRTRQVVGELGRLATTVMSGGSADLGRFAMGLIGWAASNPSQAKSVAAEMKRLADMQGGKLTPEQVNQLLGLR